MAALPWWKAGWVKVVGVVSALALGTTVLANLVTIGVLDPRPVENRAREVAADDVSQSVSEPQCNQEVIRRTWGPMREFFTLEHPATYPTLNAITDNPNWGPEAVFLNAKVVGSDAPWCSRVVADDGDIIWIRAFVENSAADNLVDENGRGEGVAADTRFRLSSDVERSTLVQLRAELTSATTDPAEIWSVVEVEADKPFRLDPVDASAEIISNVHPDGEPLRQDPWAETGALIGYDDQDGLIPPGYEYSILILAEARVTFTG